MRPLEVVLVVLVGLSALAVLVPRTPRWLLTALCFLGLLALCLHTFIEGPHWQLIPAYFAALFAPVVLTLRKPRQKTLLAIAMLLFVATASITSAILPMFQLPKPTGKYAIGTRTVYLVNDHPADPSSAQANGKRELMVQIWYPAAPSHAPRAPYRIRPETTLKSSYQSVLWTHSRWNAPVAADASPFPILLLNPAWGGRRTYYMYLVEDLVSHGYAVVGIDHTGNSGPTAFPDGHVIQPDLNGYLDFVSNSFTQLNLQAAKELAIETDDDRFVLNQLQSWNQDPGSDFYKHLDLDRVGAFGHSFGGAVSAQALLEDNRIKSALDMDGSFWGPVQKTGLIKPIMMIEEDDAGYTPAQLAQDHAALMDHLLDLGDMEMMRKSNGYLITLHGSTHSSFSDQNLLSSFRRWSGLGAIPANREYAILRSYVLAFFDKTLRGADPNLLHAGQPFPEASVKIMRRP